MESQKNKLEALDPPFTIESAKLLNNFPSKDGYLLKLFRMWANSPRHLQKFGSSSLLDKESPISLRQREIIILRTTALNKCEYEWGVHVTIFAEKAGITKHQISNTISEKLDPTLWNKQELLLLNIVDELKYSAILSSKLKHIFQEDFNVAAQLEIYALCGFYTTVAFTANNSEIGLEPFAATFEQYR